MQAASTEAAMTIGAHEESLISGPVVSRTCLELPSSDIGSTLTGTCSERYNITPGSCRAPSAESRDPPLSFVHLHCHSEYSLLDGANRIDSLIARAQEFEMPALAITDHGNLHGAWEFQEHSKKAGLKPIIGMEAYVAPGSRRERARAAPGRKPYFHLVLLARDATGYKNLVKLSSLGYTEGFYSRPRVDRELLEQYGEGIIVSSACMAGEVAVHLLDGQHDARKPPPSGTPSIFPGRYYLEVQAHDAAGQQNKLNALVFALADELSLPVVATNDAHFLRAQDHDAHDVLLCIGLQKDRGDLDRMKYDEGCSSRARRRSPTISPVAPTCSRTRSRSRAK